MRGCVLIGGVGALVLAGVVALGWQRPAQVYSYAEDEASRAAARARAPFRVPMRTVAGPLAHSSWAGGDGYVVLHFGRLDEFVTVVGGDAARYRDKRVGPPITWGVFFETGPLRGRVAAPRVSEMRLGREIDYGGMTGVRRVLDPARHRAFYDRLFDGALAEGDLLYDPAVDAHYRCGVMPACEAVFDAEGFSVRLMFSPEDRPVVGMAIADLRRALPRWVAATRAERARLEGGRNGGTDAAGGGRGAGGGGGG